MALTRIQMLQIMRDNPAVDLVYNDPSSGDNHFVVQCNDTIAGLLLKLPDDVDPAKCTQRRGRAFKTLELKTDRLGPVSDYTDCQDEPIKLGTQIQPRGAPWVGTAGCPVRWTDLQNKDHWGILSNWHVFCGGRYDVGHTQHQPTDQRSACAQLSNSTPVEANEPNTTDAAIADALVDGFHTIDWSILDLGVINATMHRAAVGDTVRKVGRTTGLTHARCSAIDATARVGYGDFEAIFTGQDVYDDVDESFSAPGDSGSLIVCDCNGGPTSLLFAGGGTQTIGNAIADVAEKFNLRFNP